MAFNPYQKRLPSAETEEETDIPGQDPEQVLQRLGSEPSAKEQAQAQQAAPESDMDRYARLSQEAEEAAPTEQDVLAAGIRRSLAESRAETPAFLQQMAETAFYKPDYSQMTKVAEAEAARPDIALTAKEQAQKRLQGLAEAARKKALLPGQMAEQQLKTTETQTKLDLLKPATPEEKAAAERDLNVKFAEGVTRGEIARARSTSAETAIKGAGVPLSEERLAGYQALINQQAKKNKLDPVTLPKGTTEDDAKKFVEIASKADTSAWREASLALREQQLGLGRERFGYKVGKQAEDETVPGVGRAATPKNADIVRQKMFGTESAKAGIDALKDKYTQLENTPITDIAKNTQLTREISMETKNLIMSFKEKYGLGAPQTAELKFLYDLVGRPDPQGVLMTQAISKLTGTTMGQKLDSLKNMLDRDFQKVKDVYIIEPETKSSQPAAQPAAAPAGQSAAKPETEAEELQRLRSKFGGRK